MRPRKAVGPRQALASAMVAKAGTASRLFGNAVAGVKKPQLKVSGKVIAKAAAPKAQPGAVAAARTKRLPDLALSEAAAASGGRVRGRVVTPGAPATQQRAVVKANGLERRMQKASRRAASFNGNGGAGRTQRQRVDAWEDDHFSASAVRKWHNDKYKGPQTVGSAVFVRNLPKGASEIQVAALFSSIGEVVSVQVDNGPLPTATVGFIRQDNAHTASERFHGHWLQGEQLKVSVKQDLAATNAGEDDDFWRKELKDMPKRQPQSELLEPSRDGGDLRGRLRNDDDEFWRQELAEMKKRQLPEPSRSSGGDLRSRLRNDDDEFWRQELAEMKKRSPLLEQSRGSGDVRGKVRNDDDDFWRQELAEMKKRSHALEPSRGSGGNLRGRLRNDDDEFWREELAEMRKRGRQVQMSPRLGPAVEESAVRQRRGRGTFVA